MSTLGRLLRFALPGGLDEESRRIAAENFTTEAFAGACRRNPGPLLLALDRAGVPRPARPPDRLLTQVLYNGPSGIVIPDTIVAWEAVDPCEVWIEVKTGAPLSGDGQLSRYRQTMDWLTDSDQIPRRLVLLSATDLRSREDASPSGAGSAWVSWQGLIDAAGDPRGATDSWLDLAGFLEEQGMTKVSNFPITVREMASLREAHALFEKGVALLAAVNRRARELGIGDATYWWLDGHVRRTAAAQFERHARVMLFGATAFPAPFYYGIASDINGEAQVTVWAEVDPRRTGSRHALLAWFAERAASLPGWNVNRDDRYYSGWPVLVVVESPVNLRSKEDAARWIIERLTELAAAGYFELIRTLGTQPAPAIAAGLEEEAEA